MQRRFESWESPHLGRPMDLLRFGDRGFPFIFFPTSMGKYVQYEDAGLIAALAPTIEAGNIQVLCVDSVDRESWYAEAAPPAARGRRHEQYDAYVRFEVVPHAQRLGATPVVGVFGCSFGAYHAANVAGRHPEVIGKAVCLSGVFDVKRFTDGYWDDVDYFNSPAAYIENMDAGWTERLARIDWTIATGEFDSLAPENRAFAELLTRKGIPHRAEIWPGVTGHDWEYWNANVPRFI